MLRTFIIYFQLSSVWSSPCVSDDAFSAFFVLALVAGLGPGMIEVEIMKNHRMIILLVKIQAGVIHNVIEGKIRWIFFLSRNILSFYCIIHT